MIENKEGNEINIENNTKEHDYALVGTLSIKANSKEEADKILQEVIEGIKALKVISEDENILKVQDLNTKHCGAYDVDKNSISLKEEPVYLSKIECIKTGCEFNSAKCSHCKTGFCTKKDVIINEDRGNTFCGSFNYIKDKYFNPCDSHLKKW